jgi:hypothetical protein
VAPFVLAGQNGAMTIPIAPIPGLEEAIQKRNESLQPAWEKNLKRGVAAVVATCGVLITTLPEHTIGYRVCFAVVAVGAALGITSTGNAKK